MIRHGEPPFLECSSRGERRLSAFYARVNGSSIEAAYQGAKVLRIMGARRAGWPINVAKGKYPENAAEVRKLYSELWDKYINEHPDLLKMICEASGLSDMFGHPGTVCQATELWRIRTNALWTPRFSTQWEQDDYEREQRGEKPLGPRSAL
jgi:hypothetical protein